MSRENRLFSGAVAVSVLVHLAVLWLAQDFGTTRRVKSLTPSFGSFEVALVSAKTSVGRTVAHRERRHIEITEAPARHHSEQSVVKTADVQPTPVSMHTGVESTVTRATDINAPIADVNSSMDKAAGAVAAGVSESVTPVGMADRAVRDRYLASVLSLIEAHKFYPTPARRRGLQGRVDVHFTLDARGGISNLDVTGSHSMFVAAARDAVNGVMPLPAAPSADGFPLAVHYQMIFKLQ